MERRRFIATAASCGVAGISGCSSLTMDSFDLQIVNQRENPVEVNVVIASAEYEETFQVAGNSGSVTKEGIAPPKEQEMTVTTAKCSKVE